MTGLNLNNSPHLNNVCFTRLAVWQAFFLSSVRRDKESFMSTVSQAPCPFCKLEANYWHVTGTQGYYGFDCHVCKAFFVTEGVLTKLEKLSPETSQGILNCISENIKSNAAFGTEIVTSWALRSTNITSLSVDEKTTVKRLEDFFDLRIDHASKATALLLILAEKAQKSSPFSSVSLRLTDIYLLKIANFEECFQWLTKLNELGLIDSSSFRTMGHGFSDEEIEKHEFSLTVDGWQAVQTEQQNVNTKKVFIAMQFNWGDETHNTIRTKYIEAIQAGCTDCGYEANIVSQNHTDYITDRIVSEIKMSKFVIADFTFNNQGAYYEAGLARGLGKKVIHTVMTGHTADTTDKFKQLHFDIKQINYIEWSDPTELRTRIADRIKSTIDGE